MLTLTLFGPLQARQGDIPLPGLNRREGSRILAYLALEQGAPVSYRTLARIFWPYDVANGNPDGGDFTNTRQAIYSLRKSLGPDADRLENRGKGIVALNLEGADVDFLEFNRMVQQASPASWEGAVSLYRGPLLEDWNEKWVLHARARCQRSLERVMRTMVEEVHNNKHYQPAADWLHHALRVTTGEESWLRALLELLARQGHLDAAEVEYETLRKLCAQTETQPEEETQRLMETLRREARQTSAVTHTGKAHSKGVEQAPALLPSNGRQVTLLYKRDLQPDETVMRLLERELAQAGYSIFVDRYVNAGVPWAREIEQQIRNSYGVIPLLSEIAVQSEMLDHEVETAHSAAQAQHGLPILLPIRVCYDAPLPSTAALSDILNPLQQLQWHSGDDDEGLVAALLKSLLGPPPLPVLPRRLEPIGGGMPIGSPYYIERTTDVDFQQALAQQDGIVLVKGARQMGKTSLLARALHQARQRGAKVVRTDFQKLNRAQMESASAFLQALATTIALQVGLPPPDKETWDPEMGANLNMEIFLCEKVLGSFEGNLVWALDEVDRLFSCDFGSEIFGLFRAWYNERALDPEGPWGRVTLAIAYATEAHLFVSDLNQSPFNVGTHLALNDFDIDEVAELNRRCGAPLLDRVSLERLYALIGGQPYLIRRALNELSVRGMTLNTLEAQADRDEGVFGDHLRRLLATLSQDEALTQVVRDMLHGLPCPTPQSFYRLRSAGIVAGEWGEEIRFRCRIYSTYLIRHIP